jgi:hypothetical protein
MLAHSLSCDVYQQLLNRGWRRGGLWLYRPLADKSECQCSTLYTIRLDVHKFQPSKVKGTLFYTFMALNVSCVAWPPSMVPGYGIPTNVPCTTVCAHHGSIANRNASVIQAQHRVLRKFNAFLDGEPLMPKRSHAAQTEAVCQAPSPLNAQEFHRLPLEREKVQDGTSSLQSVSHSPPAPLTGAADSTGCPPENAAQEGMRVRGRHHQPTAACAICQSMIIISWVIVPCNFMESQWPACFSEFLEPR